MKLAVIVSQFNDNVTSGLLKGARAYLSEHGLKEADVPVFSAPGAFEIPLIAQKLARSGKFDGVICLGCVIKGDTARLNLLALELLSTECRRPLRLKFQSLLAF